MANDQESLKKLELSCSQATRDYEDSSKSRAEEMDALKKAEKVLAEKTGATIQSVPWQVELAVVSCCDVFNDGGGLQRGS